MRKRYKDKARSCAMCKPYKKNWANRWNPKELDLIVRSEQEIREEGEPQQEELEDDENTG